METEQRYKQQGYTTSRYHGALASTQLAMAHAISLVRRSTGLVERVNYMRIPGIQRANGCQAGLEPEMQLEYTFFCQLQAVR